MDTAKFDDAFRDVQYELGRACQEYPPFASEHEGYAIIKEEIDELWEEIRKKPKDRDKTKIYKEAMQVAAMSVRMMIDMGDSGGPPLPRTSIQCIHGGCKCS